MKKVFVRSALFDEHFYAETDGVNLYDSKGKELDESFEIVPESKWAYAIAITGIVAIAAFLDWVTYSPSFYSFVIGFCDACK